MTIVRSEPAGMVSAPEATPAATGTLNTTVVGRSGAETSTTTVATDVPETSALMRRVASPPPAATASPEHAANSRREATATNGELVGAVPPHDPNLVDRCRDRHLARADQFFGQLLARAQSRKLDRDIPIRLEAREADELLGQFENPDGLAHLQDGDPSRGFRQRGRLEDQLYRLRDGHEVAGHFRGRHPEGAGRPA